MPRSCIGTLYQLGTDRNMVMVEPSDKIELGENLANRYHSPFITNITNSNNMPRVEVVLDYLKLFVSTAIIAIVIQKLFGRISEERRRQTRCVYDRSIFGGHITATNSNKTNKVSCQNHETIRETCPATKLTVNEKDLSEPAISSRLLLPTSVLKSDSHCKPSQYRKSKDAISRRNYDKIISTVNSNNILHDNENEFDNLSCRVTGTTPNSSDENDKNLEVSWENNQKLKCNASIQSYSKQSSSPLRTQPRPSLPQFSLESQEHHPGLSAYYRWYSTITSLYRVYAIPLYNDFSESNMIPYQKAVLPIHPSSERGQTPLYIEVRNLTKHERIDVFWLDYKGNEVFKGSVRNSGGTWSQTTYIGHPWTFRVASNSIVHDDDEESVLLKYVPFQVIPTIHGCETTSKDVFGDQVIGVQKFTLMDAPEKTSINSYGHTYRPICTVEDEALPEPQLSLIDYGDDSNNPKNFSEISNAIKWSCQQMQREDVITPGRGLSSAKCLMKYLRNICLHPENPKHRRLRCGNPVFRENIYNTGARGVLLALGFEEHYGMLECRLGRGKMLRSERLQMISSALTMVDDVCKLMNEEQLTQPVGADGFGRAGYGYAGSMNS